MKYVDVDQRHYGMKLSHQNRCKHWNNHQHYIPIFKIWFWKRSFWYILFIMCFNKCSGLADGNQETESFESVPRVQIFLIRNVDFHLISKLKENILTVNFTYWSLTEISIVHLRSTWSSLRGQIYQIGLQQSAIWVLDCWILV